jgi:hypothetical protein
VLGVVVGCGGAVDVAGGPGGGGPGNGGGGAGVGGSGGGGGDTGPSPRVVKVTSSSGAPEGGVEVVAQGASGEVLDHQTTGEEGTVTVVAPDHGMITLAYQIVEVFPGGPGGTTTHEQRNRLFTFAVIGDRAMLSHGIERPRARAHNAPMTVELTGNAPSASSALVMMTCHEGGWLAQPIGTVSLPSRGCPGESTFDIVVETFSASVETRRMVFESVAYEPGSTVFLTFDDGDLTPTPADHGFEALEGYSLGVTVVGFDDEGGFRIRGFAGPDPSPILATPPTTGVASWLISEWLEGMSQARQRHVAGVPASSSWTVEPLAVASAPAAVLGARLEASWSFIRGGLAGDAVEVQWTGLGASGPTEWRLLLPASSAYAAFPALPPAIETMLPSGGSIQVVVVDSLSGDRAALFESLHADRVHTWSEITSLP